MLYTVEIVLEHFCMRKLVNCSLTHDAIGHMFCIFTSLASCSENGDISVNEYLTVDIRVVLCYTSCAVSEHYILVKKSLFLYIIIWICIYFPYWNDLLQCSPGMEP